MWKDVIKEPVLIIWSANINTIAKHKADIESYKGEVTKRKELIDVIKEEEVLIRNWKIFLEWSVYTLTDPSKPKEENDELN